MFYSFMTELHEYRIFCDGKLLFDSRDSCNAIDFFMRTNEEFKRRKIKRKLEFFCNERKISVDTLGQISWC